MPPALRYLVTAVACALAAFATQRSPGSARAAIQPASGEIRLVAQPVWHGPKRPLNITLGVTNTGSRVLEDFRLQLSLYERVTTRTALQQAVEDNPQFFNSSEPRDYEGVEVAPGESIEVRLGGRASELGTLGTATEGGVYPLKVELRERATFQILDELTTLLLYYPTEPETPLNTVVVLPLNDVPARSPDGVFRSDGEGRWPLEDALERDGWLAGMLDAALRHSADGLRLAVATTPRLIEEIADMSDGYRRADADASARDAPATSGAALDAARWLDDAQALLQARSVRPLATPYSYADLPVVSERGGLEALADQFSESEQILQSALDVSVDRTWLWPPDGRLDGDSLNQLRGSLQTGMRTFFAPDTLVPSPDPGQSGCPDPATSFTCPVEIETPFGPTVGFVSDTILQQRLAALRVPDYDRRGLQAFFAETAMIREERPGTEGRVINIVVPPRWQPEPDQIDTLLSGLAEAPWLRTLTPPQGLSRAAQRSPRTLIEAAPPNQDAFDESVFAESADAQRMFASFNQMFEGNTAANMRLRMRRNLLVAQSRIWWEDPLLMRRGTNYASETRSEMLKIINNISLVGAEIINFTSERGQIQFVAANGSRWPIVVDIVFESPKLAVDSLLDESIPQGDHPVQVPAQVQSSGTFPLSIMMSSPDGGLQLAAKTITIRSTNFNEVALGLTLGAFAFLVLFYVWRALRTRRRRSERTATV